MIFVLVYSGEQVELFFKCVWGWTACPAAVTLLSATALQITAVIIFKINSQFSK